jgi:hypothetical protein
MSIDDSTSTQLWAGTSWGGATPGNPLTFRAQKAMLDNCNHVKRNGWVDRCFVYDNMVVSLGWYESHRAKMLDPASWHLFNIMNNRNATSGLANYTGLPYLEPLGTLVPCWPLPNFAQHEWCGPISDIRLPCFAKGTCNISSGDGEGFSFYWNYSAPGAVDWRVTDTVASLPGGEGVDGLFTDEMEMFPRRRGQRVLGDPWHRPSRCTSAAGGGAWRASTNDRWARGPGQVSLACVSRR